MNADEPEHAPEPFDLDAEQPPGYPWMLTAAGIIWFAFGVVGTGVFTVAVGFAFAGWRVGQGAVCCLPFTAVFISDGWNMARGRPRNTLGTAAASVIIGAILSTATLAALVEDINGNRVDGYTFAYRAASGSIGGGLVSAGVLAIVGRIQLRKREQAAREVEHEREPE